MIVRSLILKEQIITVVSIQIQNIRFPAAPASVCTPMCVAFYVVIMKAGTIAYK